VVGNLMVGFVMAVATTLMLIGYWHDRRESARNRQELRLELFSQVVCWLHHA
jgi:hypothetical protein